MGAKELQQALLKLKEKEKIQNELKKRLFLEEYFSWNKIKNFDVIKDLKISKEEFNQVYLQTFNNNQRINIYYGGSGSGKSEYIARRYILKFLLEPGHNLLAVRKFGTDVRTSIYKLFIKIIKEYLQSNKDKYVKVNKSEMTFTFWNGNQILLKGLDDTEKIKSITFEQGPLTDIWFEECSQGTGEEIKELNRRIRGKADVKKEIVLSFNPVSKANWVYVKYFNLEIEAKKFYQNSKILILKTTIYDNKYATEEDRKVLEDQDDPYDKEVYLWGNFGVIDAEDCIVNYSDAMRATERVVDDEGEIFIGLDCAGMGDDKNVAKVRKGAKQLDYGFELSKVEEAVVVEKMIQIIDELQEKYKKKNPNFDKSKSVSNLNEEYFVPTITCNIDSTGVGHGTASQLRTKKSRGIIKKVEINAVSFGGSALDVDRYFNVVTEMYFTLRKKLKEGMIQLLKDVVAINEICSRKYTIEEKKSRRRIEDKKSFKKRLKKSPDNGDALALAFYVPKKKRTSFGVFMD